MASKFEKMLHFNFKVNQEIIQKIAKIENFRGVWAGIGKLDNQVLSELKHIATIQSIGSSTRIEGSQLSDNEISNLMENIQINQLETRDQQEVIGYWEALEIVLENASELALSQNYIFQMHSYLLRHSSKDLSKKGRFKNLSNKVVAKYPDGSEKIIFNTTEPHMVNKEMEEILDWTNQELESGEMNPLIIIATFIYEFLSIHPFHDGNGRMSRLLTTLLLVKEDYQFVQYISFEHIIEERKKEYYQALMDGQKDRGSDAENISKWMMFFLECVESLAKKLEKKLESISNKGVYLNSRQKHIIEIMSNMGEFKISDIYSGLDGAGLSTIKKDLKYLSVEGLIERIGVGKATRYKLKMSTHITNDRT